MMCTYSMLYAYADEGLDKSMHVGGILVAQSLDPCICLLGFKAMCWLLCKKFVIHMIY